MFLFIEKQEYDILIILVQTFQVKKHKSKEEEIIMIINLVYTINFIQKTNHFKNIIVNFNYLNLIIKELIFSYSLEFIYVLFN